MSFEITKISLLPAATIPDAKAPPPYQDHSKYRNTGTVITAHSILNGIPVQYIPVQLLPPDTTVVADVLIRADNPGADLNITLLDGRHAVIWFGHATGGRLAVRGNIGSLVEVNGQAMKASAGLGVVKLGIREGKSGLLSMGRKKFEVMFREDGVLLLRGVDGLKWFVGSKADGEGVEEVGIEFSGLRPLKAEKA